MKPIIIISPNVKEDGSFSLSDAYTRAIEEAGGIPLILPYTKSPEAIDNYLDISGGVLFSGGGDISTTLYGEDSGEPIPERDIFEIGLLGEALKRKKPVMAICRGLQLVNVYFGGTLIQDIPTSVKTEISHRQTFRPFSQEDLLSVLVLSVNVSA